MFPVMMSREGRAAAAPNVPLIEVLLRFPIQELPVLFWSLISFWTVRVVFHWQHIRLQTWKGKRRNCPERFIMMVQNPCGDLQTDWAAGTSITEAVTILSIIHPCGQPVIRDPFRLKALLEASADGVWMWWRRVGYEPHRSLWISSAEPQTSAWSSAAERQKNGRKVKTHKTASARQQSAALIGRHLSQRGRSDHFPVGLLHLSLDIIFVIKHVLGGGNELRSLMVLFSFQVRKSWKLRFSTWIKSLNLQPVFNSETNSEMMFLLCKSLTAGFWTWSFL